MTNISTTINATEALQARIDLYNEDLLKYEADLKKLKIKEKNAKSKEKFYTVSAYLTWMFDVLIALILFSSFEEIAFSLFIVALFGFAGYMFLRKSKKYAINDLLLKEINDLEEHIVKLKEEVSTLKQEKRDFLLSSERQIKIIEENSIIKKDFSPEVLNSDMKECPMCAEMVKSRAKICRYCGYNFLDANSKQPMA